MWFQTWLAWRCVWNRTGYGVYGELAPGTAVHEPGMAPDVSEKPVFPVILSVAGFDPGAGAGLQADLLTGAALGTHVCTAVTSLTVQDSAQVHSVQVLDPSYTRAQMDVLMADFPVAAVKVGMLGSAAMGRMLARFLECHPGIPVVLDPILRSGGGQLLSGPDLVETLLLELLPRVQVLTPNAPEILSLSGAGDVDQAAAMLAGYGAEWVLVSGGHGEGVDLDNRLYRHGVLEERFVQKRLPGVFHGSGCTLSTAIAAGLAQGRMVPEAVNGALDFTARAVAHARSLGRGQFFLDRCAFLSGDA